MRRASLIAQARASRPIVRACRDRIFSIRRASSAKPKGLSAYGVRPTCRGGVDLEDAGYKRNP
jgi:hypothetical protein